MRTTRLRVTLREVSPPVVRVLDVPASSTLPELHCLLQVGLGWTDSHLHQFVAGEVSYGVPHEEWPSDERDEAGARLKDLPAGFGYRYDFGDGWEHDVEVLGTGGDRPGCPYGEGACPPEDCGGPWGYTELLAILADPAHDEHAARRAWAGELADFDQPGTDRLVRQTVGEVPDSVRLVLELAADGVQLTPGGRLPRAFVRRVQERRPHWSCLDRPASIEEDLFPLAALHDLLRTVGLLRLNRGVLRPIRAAGEDLEVVRRLRSWFALDGFTDLLSGLVVAVLLTNAPRRDADLVGEVHGLLGPGWVRGRRPLTEADVRTSIYGIDAVLRGLDLVETGRDGWRPGPSARCLLPRATALAHLWGPAETG